MLLGAQATLINRMERVKALKKDAEYYHEITEGDRYWEGQIAVYNEELNFLDEIMRDYLSGVMK